MFDSSSSRRNLAAATVVAVAGLSACSQPVVQESPGGATGAMVHAVDPAPSARGRAAGATTLQAKEADGAGARARRDRVFLHGSATRDAAGGAGPTPVAQGSTWNEAHTASALMPRRFLAERTDLSDITTTPVVGTPVVGMAAGDAAKPAASAQCAALQKDLDADLGEVLRAGCEPSLAQMSALMDNPLGNVAMLFTQFDLYRMENPLTGKSANKWNYMGIAQFPKSINKDWNLINRVVWNVPSMPLDQDKIDRAADRGQRLVGSGSE
ncbi:MAG: hypothetical protein ACYTGX_18320 [Planctomycetota bacterium]|jgi:hypothetical protein